jgi:hypothetical protein
MGRLLHGPNGPITGKVGNIVSYILNGQNLTRIQPKRKKKKLKQLSVVRQATCLKIRLVNEFFLPIKGLLKVGFSIAADGTTQNYHNLATSYYMKNVIPGTMPDFAIDYAKALISVGDLPMPAAYAIESFDNELRFSWSYDAIQYEKDKSDQAMILIYFPDTATAISIYYGEQRQKSEQTVLLLSSQKKERMEIYLSFISADRKGVATSVNSLKFRHKKGSGEEPILFRYSNLTI